MAVTNVPGEPLDSITDNQSSAFEESENIKSNIDQDPEYAKQRFVKTCLQTAEGMSWPKYTQVRLLVYMRNENPYKSEIFESDHDKKMDANLDKRKHAEVYAIDYILKQEGKVTKVVFFLNYAPCNNCWRDQFKERLNKQGIEFEIVYIMQYKYDNECLKEIQANKETKEEPSVCERITHWKWTAFLLWNEDCLRQDLEWWKMLYEECEVDIEGGLHKAGIQYKNLSKYTQKLLKELVYIESGISLSGFHKPLTVKDIAKKLYCGDSLEPTLSKDDLEHFFASVLIDSPARNEIMHIIVKRENQRPETVTFSQRCQMMSFLHNITDGDIVLIANCELWDSIEQLLKDQREKKLSIDIVTTRPTQHLTHDSNDIKVSFYTITNWRWCAFLLWNSGFWKEDIEATDSAPPSNWWKDPFEKCEMQMEKGFARVGIDYMHSKQYMKDLLEMSYNNMELIWVSQDIEDKNACLDMIYDI